MSLSSPERRKLLLGTLGQVPLSRGAPALVIDVAGVRVGFVTRSEMLVGELRRFYAEYVAEKNGAEPLDGCLSLEPFASDSLWERDDAEFELGPDGVVQRDFAARALPSGGAIALVAPGLDDSVHNLLRWFLPDLLLSKGAFLLHGAGLVHEGRGYVFFGQSGAGKSTSLGLAAEAEPRAVPLGDDAVIIRMEAGGPAVHPAPLGSGYTRRAPPRLSAPLAGLYSLRQSESEDRIEPLAPSEGVAALLASAMCVGFEARALDRIELASRFAMTGPGIRRLHFRKTPDFWDKVENQGAL